MWLYIMTAIALVLVIEGLLPSISPANYKQMLIRLSQQSDKNLRVFGLVLMILGALIMLLIHGGL